MSLNLSKGQKLDLTKTNPGLKKVRLGLGWSVPMIQGKDFDLDATVVLLDKNSKVRKDNDVIFYNNLVSECGSVIHQGDNRTGDGDGDDEVILIELDKIPLDVEKIVTLVTIHEAKSRGQNFGQVQNAYIRIINDDSETEIAKFDLTEDFSVQTSIIFCEVYRHNGDWKFNPIGDGDTRDLGGLLSMYGVQL